jgi:hypothetical protein
LLMEADTATIATERTPERSRVIHWRTQELLRAGYSDFAADVLAVHTDIDLHRAVELPQNGCPHDLALQILL